jgi:hypothetical protein
MDESGSGTTATLPCLFHQECHQYTIVLSPEPRLNLRLALASHNPNSNFEHELHADLTVHNRPGSGPIVDWDVKSVYEMTGITRPHVVRPDGQAEEREEWSWA